MPDLNISVPHSLPQEEALQRLKRFLSQIKTQYKDTITNLDEHWNENVGTFNVSGRGLTGSGRMTVNESEVLVESSLPAVAMFFKGTIEAKVREWLSRVLASTPA